MPKPFNPATERQELRLSQTARIRLHELLKHDNTTATAIVERAIADLWQRELGTPGRDPFAEIDALKQQMRLVTDALFEAGHDPW